MPFSRFGRLCFLYTMLLLPVIPVVITKCTDISSLDISRRGYKHECYGNCKYVIPSVVSMLFCIKECLRFSFCTAVNYNRDTLECELVYIQGALQPEMVIANTHWDVVYANEAQQDLVGVCAEHSCQSNQKCVEVTSGAHVCVNHGIQLAPGFYGALLPNTRLYHPQGNTSVTMYECTALTDPVATESNPVAKIVDGVYTTATVSCSAADCLNPAKNYMGYVTVTVNGTTCQRWDSEIPHSTSHLVGRSDLRNWCRLPETDDQARPWCYTIDPDIRWEFCPIIDCP